MTLTMDDAHELLDRIITTPRGNDTLPLLERLVDLSRSASYRNLLASCHAVPCLLPLLKPNSFSCSEALVLLLKLLRNLCAGESSNQLAFLQNDGVSSVSDLLALNLERNTFDSGKLRSVLRFSLQLLGNSCGGGEPHKEAIWSTFFPLRFLSVASVGKDDQIMEPLSMVLYTCCHGVQERLVELCHGQGAALLSCCLMAIYTGNGDLYAGSSDWISLLLLELCIKEPLLPHLFINLTASYVHASFRTEYSMQLAETTFCEEHVILLTCVIQLIKCMLDGQEFGAVSVKNIVGRPLPFTSIQFLKDAVGVTSRRLMHEIADEMQPQDIHILQNVLEIFKILSASENEFRSSVIADILSTGFISLCLELLRDLGPPDLIAESIKKHGELESTEKERIRCPLLYQGYRRDILAILANASYQNRAVQDEIRNQGGLPIVLQQCVVDEHNPFLREWGFWAMRNLLHDNLDNIKEISELQLKGSVTPTELEQSGYKVEIDPLLGRPKLVNISSMKH